MVTIQQVRQGMCRYIDTEFINKIGGLAKWGVAIGGSLIVEKYTSDPSILKSIGCLSEDGMVDIDRLYDIVYNVAKERGKVTQNFPMIGDVSFTEEDVTKLYHYITNR